MLKAAQIVDALKRGAYHSSTGPEIHDISYDGANRLVVRCSPASWVFARGIGSSVIDRDGRRAWSNPIERTA